jgi:hypothetical protein
MGFIREPEGSHTFGSLITAALSIAYHKSQHMRPQCTSHTVDMVIYSTHIVAPSPAAVTIKCMHSSTCVQRRLQTLLQDLNSHNQALTGHQLRQCVQPTKHHRYHVHLQHVVPSGACSVTDTVSGTKQYCSIASAPVKSRQQAGM